MAGGLLKQPSNKKITRLVNRNDLLPVGALNHRHGFNTLISSFSLINSLCIVHVIMIIFHVILLFESKINKLITKKNSLCKIQFQNLLDQHLLLMRKSAICCKVNFTGRRPALRIFTETMVSILTSGALFSCWVNVPQISLPSLVPQRKIYIVLSQVSMATILYTTIYVYSLSNEKINGNSWKTNLQKQKNTFFFLLWS